MDNKCVAFQGELMLLSWSESSARGRTVTFQLSEEGDSHPFKDFTIRAGKRAGQRFMGALAQIDDDEHIVQQRRTGSQTAAIYCKSADFWAWASRRTFDVVNTEESARKFIISTLGIQSRSEIDKDPDVTSRFSSMIVIPFDAYQKSMTPEI